VTSQVLADGKKVKNLHRLTPTGRRSVTLSRIVACQLFDPRQRWLPQYPESRRSVPAQYLSWCAKPGSQLLGCFHVV